MSVRRLAPTDKQPKAFAFSKDSQKLADWWIAKYPDSRRQSAVIPLLWLVQKQEGWVSEPAIKYLGELLGMPYVRVYEVATFYTMFHLQPVGKHVFQVCGTTPCMLRGANELKAVCQSKLGAKDSISGDCTWQEVECVGACANAPVVQINDYYYEDLTPEQLSQLIDDFRSGKNPAPGPMNGRHLSAPVTGEKTLLDPALYDGHLAKPIKKLPNAPTATKVKTEKA
jgi:NADH-quinone oxidoreductase subunit E